MPHLKCEACRVRVHDAYPARTARCPVCDGPLEPVGALAEVVGFKAVALSGDSPEAGHVRLADEVAKVMARRRASAARAWSEVNRDAP